jgi:hypothetical protein
MSLLLAHSYPEGLEVKTHHSCIRPLANKVLLGGCEITFEDFFDAVEYVLTNTDLEPDDIRLRFLERVKGIKEVDGWDEEGKRLDI